jgi:hypothetical protein
MVRTGALALAAALIVGLAAPAAAHDEAKTPIKGSIILDIVAPRPEGRDRAFDESLRQPGPPPARKLEGEVQPDGSVRYGNTTVIIHRDCPPGSEFFEPPPLPGRRRR